MRVRGAWCVAVGLALWVGCGKSTDVAQQGGSAGDAPTTATASAEGGAAADEGAMEEGSPSAPAGAGSDAASTDAGDAAGEFAGDKKLQAIVQLAQTGEFAKAHEAAAAGLAADPKNRELVRIVVQLKQLLARQKLEGGDEAAAYALFRESAKEARRLTKELGPAEEGEHELVAMVLYNDACASAKEKKTDETLATLKEMVEYGFTNLAQLDADEDFAGIREEAAFQEWREAAGKQIAEAFKKQALEELAANKSFEFDFTLADPDGKSHKLADLKGKVVLVDFWGTWCPPCRMEIPHLIAIQKKYAEKGVAVVGLNYNEEKDSDITDFVKQHEIPYPCLVGDEATMNQVPDFRGFPTMLFLDRTGKVRLKHVGYTPQANLEAVIDALLAEGQG